MYRKRRVQSKFLQFEQQCPRQAVDELNLEGARFDFILTIYQVQCD